MSAKMTFDPNIALKLYHELKNDVEIGKILGIKPNTIASWRIRKKLRSIAVKTIKGDETYLTHLDYRKALTPAQSKQMNTFLIVLSAAGRKAVKAGVKPDVAHFMNVYSGRYKTEEEKKIEAMWQERERKRA